MASSQSSFDVSESTAIPSQRIQAEVWAGGCCWDPLSIPPHGGFPYREDLFLFFLAEKVAFIPSIVSQICFGLFSFHYLI